ncbi:MAG: hypothetical protein CVU44_11115 [Chloroflexi bacterium HGW-Chloroflexi-6]|nr:MAG: hypothetical protein CVU44_11115 [Chloroflexi bacterium HGW-Chloroflexi-6]
MADYAYWLSFDIPKVGRIASYFTNAAPPGIGERISLLRFKEYAFKPELIISDIYRVTDVLHSPRDISEAPYADAPQSEIDFVIITIEPLE